MAASTHSVGIAHLTVVPRDAAVTGEDEEEESEPVVDAEDETAETP